MNRYVYGEGSMGWEPEPKFTHVQRVRNEITKALHGEQADLALVAQFLDEISVHGFLPGASATSELGSLPDPDSAGSRLLTEQDAERRAFEAWCEKANYTSDDPGAPHEEAFFGGYRAALVARDAEWDGVSHQGHLFSGQSFTFPEVLRMFRAMGGDEGAARMATDLAARDTELAETQRTLAEVRVYAHGFKDAVAELEAQLTARDTELAAARAEIERLKSGATASQSPVAEVDEAREAAIMACPEPFWHRTHRYCPCCPWTEGTPVTKGDDRVVQEAMDRYAKRIDSGGLHDATDGLIFGGDNG